ncbi:MAG: thermonuclease family protein [Erythrobacter sp.]
MRGLIFIIVGMFVPCGLAAQIMLGQARAVDGDTFFFGNTMYQIRGIDALELPQVCMGDNGAWPCGEAAKEMLATLLANGALQCSRSAPDPDGRIIASCSAGNKDLGYEMVAAGYAVSIQNSDTRYVAAQADAKSQRLGMWRGEHEVPAAYRAANAQYSQPRPPTQSQSSRSRSAVNVQRVPPSGGRPRVYYYTCSQAWAEGKAPIFRGEPGYREGLDGDYDGIACEPYRGRRR